MKKPLNVFYVRRVYDIEWSKIKKMFEARSKRHRKGGIHAHPVF